MKRLGFSQCAILFGLLGLTLTVSRGHTNTLIVPKEAENRFGSVWADPFFFGQGYVEQVYAASEFAGVPEDVFVLTEISFRIDDLATRPLDAVKPFITLEMNVFPGSMEEIVQRKSGIVTPQITVFSGTNVHLTAREGLVGAFDVRFTLQQPFVYDRRLGHLCLSVLSWGEYSGRARDMDAQGIFIVPGDSTSGISFERGVYIYREPIGTKQVTPTVMVTRFIHTATLAVIEGIGRFEETVQIDVRIIGSARTIRVEGSSDVNGPYSVEPNTEINMMGEGKVRCVIRASDSGRYFRIQVE